jgi:hypothetical protein
MENDRYVVWDYAQNYWTIGTLARAAGTDRGQFANPLYITPDGYIYDHEVGVNHGGAEVYLESGPVQVGNGDRVFYVNELIPDERTQGQVTVSFSTKYYPNAPVWTHGPYSMANPTSVRFNGRQVKMKIIAQDNTDWRVGTMRLEAIGGGRR